ncbi:MAG: molybdopterin cofactor-binding domain-containing protein, partial [Actinomycetota bacterium]
LAHRLGADPLAFRLAHLQDDRVAAVLAEAARRIGWRAGAAVGTGTGLGLACGVEKEGRVATAAAVEVDEEGRLHILQVVTAFESGAAVHPDNLRNQIEGATVMGLGGALFEAIELAGARITNGSLTRYRVPRFADIPPIEVALIDRRDLPPTGGGESPILTVAPALANAIHQATGRRIRSMPLAPGGVIPPG